jgi:hypothetical protein
MLRLSPAASRREAIEPSIARRFNCTAQLLVLASARRRAERRRPNKQMEDAMPKYMFEAHYSVEGAKGVMKEGGSGRRAAIAKMAEGVGGKLESLYFAFGR